MNTKMVLIPWERFKAMQPKDISIRETSNQPPDVELKLRRQKTLRKAQHPKEPTKRPVSLSLDTFSARKRSKASALIKHINRNRDRIRYDTGELQFDGIKVGDSDITDLTSAVVNDARPEKVPGWTAMMNALEATGASPYMYGSWKKRYKNGDWGSR